MADCRYRKGNSESVGGYEYIYIHTYVSVCIGIIIIITYIYMCVCGFIPSVVSHKGIRELYMMYIPYGLQIYL